MGKGGYRLRVKGGRGSKTRLTVEREDKPSLLGKALTIAGRAAGKGVRLAASALADAAAADDKRAEPVMGATGRRLVEAVLPRTRPAPAEPLSAEIEAIGDYTRRHSELMRAHHFLFDLRAPAGSRPNLVVMGVNPGEADEDWRLCPGPTEETSRFDFHVVHGGGRDHIRWVREAKTFLAGEAYVQTELFFWSSKKTDDAFTERFGPLKTSPHLPFCMRMNRRLLEVYRPRAVVVVGLECIGPITAAFNLSQLRVEKLDRHRMVEHWTDGVRPWLFTKHWTGSHGFSNAQREIVRAYLARHAGIGRG